MSELYISCSGIIEQVVQSKLRTNRIPDLSPDDLAQEIRIKCTYAMAKFDPARIGPSPYQYLSTVASNHIYNLKRGTWVPNNPPCLRCDFWDREHKVCSIAELNCAKIVRYRNNMRIKAALRGPTPQPPVLSEDTEEDMLPQNLRFTPDTNGYVDLIDYLFTKIPAPLKSHLFLLLDGQDIPDHIMKKLKVHIRKIYKQYINE